MTLQWDFSDRTVLITGAAQGIGAALTCFFREAGAKVVALDLDAKKLLEAHGPGPGILNIGTDISDRGSLASAFEKIADSSPGVSVLINNAGIARDAMVWKLTDEQWEPVLGVHLSGTFFLTRSVIPYMRQQNFGRIVNVTSYTGLHETWVKPTTQQPRQVS